MAFVNLAAKTQVVTSLSKDVDGGDRKEKKQSLSKSVSNLNKCTHKSYGPFKCNDRWWRKTVIYEIYVRSFKDSNGDGIGDIKGIQQKLDHFTYLGVETLWLTPFYPSPMVDFGYDISDFKEVDPLFGTMSDFLQLLSAMKDKGLKIILDFVPNHTSDKHTWFTKSVLKETPYSDYYIWKTPKGFDANGMPIPPNNWTSVFGGSMWEYNELRQEYYLHQFAKEQPDLNFRNPLVVQELVNILNFWLELGVDGFRLDAAPHLLEDEKFRDNPQATLEDDMESYSESDYCFWEHKYTCNCDGVIDILATFKKVCEEWSAKTNTERVLMTEGYLPLPGLMKYYGTETEPVADFSFNFELLGLKKGDSAAEAFACITRWLDALPDHCWPNWQTGNHDQPRISSKLGSEFVDIMNMIMLLLPGTAVSYYGEEIGMKNISIQYEKTVDPAGLNAGPLRYHLFTRDPERSPMQWNAQTASAGFSTSSETWLPVNTDYTHVNVESQMKADRSHLQTYRKLVSLRKSKAWQNGDIDIKVLCDGSVLAFSRADIMSNESLLVAANFSDTTAQIDLKQFCQCTGSGTIVVLTELQDEFQEGSTLNLEQPFSLNAKTGVVCKFS